MKPPEPELRHHVGQWVHKAEIDYSAAERLLEDEPLREAIAFHCQQAVEKYIKAFLVRHEVDFPKTHDIEHLLEILAETAPDLAGQLSDTDRLTPYGVQVRYPGDFPEVLIGGEQDLFALAKLTREAVMERLRPFLQDSTSTR